MLPWLSAALLAVVVSSAGSAPSQYTDEMYRKAVARRLENRDAYAIVTIENGRNGASRTGCQLVGALASVISLEHGWPFDLAHSDRVTAELLASPLRHFIFNEQSALLGSGYPSFKHDGLEACRLLRAGIPAEMQDRTGKTVRQTP